MLRPNLDEPIITSVLDTDFYKFSMGQFVFKRYSDVSVRYRFINRTQGVPLARVIREEDLRRELDRARVCHANHTEIHYLRGTNEYGDRMFSEPYLQFLEGLKALPSYELTWGADSFNLEFTGPWSQAIYWEVLALEVVNELYNRALLKKRSRAERDEVFATGVKRLMEKVRILRANPGIFFSDFGSRRRFLRAWHDYVVGVLAEELPRQLRGPSNVSLAMKYGLVPMGTAAHELQMVITSLFPETRDGVIEAQKTMLEEWWQEYGAGLSIALPDTFGSKHFFEITLGLEWVAEKWRGFRGDSGNLITEGFRGVGWYRANGIDPRTKLYIPSDGLELPTILEIYDQLKDLIQLSFGWGTNLTNDLGVKPLSLVVKPVEANGRGLVKLSNNIAKATGRPEDIERMRKIVGYDSTFNEACKY